MAQYPGKEEAKEKCFLSVFSGWHADCYSSGSQRVTQPTRVITSVCQKCIGIGKKVLENGCTFVVADLSFSQQKQDRAPMPVINDMEFGFRPPFVL